MTLRELLDKATPRPWKLNPKGTSGYEFSSINMDDEKGYLVLSVGSVPVGYDGCDHWLEFERIEDAPLITALANNAEAFIELWEAAEALRWEADYDWDENAVNRLVGEGELKAAVEALRPLMEGDE